MDFVPTFTISEPKIGRSNFLRCTLLINLMDNVTNWYHDPDQTNNWNSYIKNKKMQHLPGVPSPSRFLFTPCTCWLGLEASHSPKCDWVQKKCWPWLAHQPGFNKKWCGHPVIIHMFNKLLLQQLLEFDDGFHLWSLIALSCRLGS